MKCLRWIILYWVLNNTIVHIRKKKKSTKWFYPIDNTTLPINKSILLRLENKYSICRLPKTAKFIIFPKKKQRILLSLIVLVKPIRIWIKLTFIRVRKWLRGKRMIFMGELRWFKNHNKFLIKFKFQGLNRVSKNLRLFKKLPKLIMCKLRWLVMDFKGREIRRMWSSIRLTKSILKWSKGQKLCLTGWIRWRMFNQLRIWMFRDRGEK